MNTKWNWLMVLALLVMLLGWNVAPARAESVVTILPETIPGGTLYVWYEQAFSLSGGTGTYTWYFDGLPDQLTGIDPNIIEGFPHVAGTFPITVTATSDADPTETYSRTYELVVPKVTPTIVFPDWNLPVSNLGESFTIRAYANYTYGPTSYHRPVDGTFAFYLDNALIPVAGCESLYDGTLADGSETNAECEFPDNLAVGEHTIRVDFTPDESENYNNTSATVTHTIGYYIEGYAFNDHDRDGVWDTGEPDAGGVNLKLDKDCDGTYEGGLHNGSYTTGSDGYFDFDWLYPNVEYCLMLDPATTTNYVQTTYTDPIYMDGNKSLELGAHWLSFSINPEIPPSGHVGDDYFQQFTAIDGTPPYVISLDTAKSVLPAGIAWDDSADTLSGAPTEAGAFPLDFHAEDAATPQRTFDLHTTLKIIGDANFELTSSPNPSDPGAEVTFTLSATGIAHFYTSPTQYQTYPPLGMVTFLDGEMPIEGCSDIYLNLNTSGGVLTFGDYPAVCKTSSLAEGQHTITAAYTDLMGLFNNAAPILIQDVSYSISGMVFNDANGNGTWDLEESGLAGAYVSVDLGCTGNPIRDIPVNPDGSYSVTGLTLGACVALSGGYPTGNISLGWKETTAPVKFDPLSSSQSGINIGLQEYSLTYSPSGPGNLPDGQVGQPYSQTITVSGGVAPYYYSMTSESNLPANGLDVVMDTSTGVITVSGTPTVGGEYVLDMYVYDANGVRGPVQGFLYIQSNAADLSRTQTDSKDPVKPGAQLVYTLTVKNLGPNTAESPTLVDTLDRNTTYVSVSAPKGWSCKYAKYAVNCTSTSLASGSSAVIKITVIVNKAAKAGKELVNNATVSSVTYDPVMINNSVVQKTLVAK